MKKLILPLYAILSLGFVGVAHAKERPSHLELVCHNGSTYIDENMPEEPRAYLIAISTKGRAVEKHEANHGDCVGANISGDTGTGEVCELVDGEIVCKVATSCSCL